MGDVPLEAELLGIARRAARACGAELLARWRGPLQIDTKSTDTDPVSEADVAGENAIREILARERPADAILGEEGGATAGDGSSPGSGAGALRWVIDPLDGTVNYLYGLPAWVVSVAVEDERGGLAGVVYDPVRDESYLATRSGPALSVTGEDRDGEILHGSGCERFDHALIGTGFAYDAAVRAVQGRVAAELLPRARDIRRAGAAALDMCWVAAGRLDAYYERGVKPWDISAGTLICERAGLLVRPLPEVPAGAGAVALPSGVLAAPAALADELHALIGGAHPAG